MKITIFERSSNLSNFISIFVLFLYTLVFLAELFANDGIAIADEVGLSTRLGWFHLSAIIAVAPEPLNSLITSC